jgi:hypothetical protein
MWILNLGTMFSTLREHAVRCFTAGDLLLLYDSSGSTLAAQTLVPKAGCGSGISG